MRSQRPTREPGDLRLSQSEQSEIITGIPIPAQTDAFCDGSQVIESAEGFASFPGFTDEVSARIDELIARF